jgi:hypothetical protein
VKAVFIVITLLPMFTAFVLLVLGTIVNVVVFANRRETSYPRFTSLCTRCGYRLPPMEQPPIVSECPGCLWMDKAEK